METDRGANCRWGPTGRTASCVTLTQIGLKNAYELGEEEGRREGQTCQRVRVIRNPTWIQVLTDSQWVWVGLTEPQFPYLQRDSG